MSGEAPEGWTSVTLGDVIRLEYGRALSASSREVGGIPVYGSNGICGQHSVPLVTERGIVVGRKGSAGSVTVTSGPFWPIDTTYFVVPRLAVDFDWLASTLVHARLSNLNEATGVPGLNRDKAYLQPVLMPPTDEQRRIAEVLRAVDEASRKAQDVSHLEARLGDRLAGGLFAGAGRSQPFQETKLGTLPANWSVSEWGSLCTMVGVGIASSATHAYSSEGIPLIRNQNILFGSLDLTDLLRVTPEYDQQYASKRLKTGDVITMRTGYPGRSAVVPPDLDGSQTFTTLISRPKQDMVTPAYLCGWINSERGRREVLRLQAGGAQQNLNAGSLRHLLVPVPPMEEQNAIVKMLQGFDRNRAIEQSFAAVRDAIRCDLLSGRVRVPG